MTVTPHAVDAWLESQFCAEDDALAAVLARNSAAGLPPIDVSPLQARLLTLLAAVTGARRILEVGALGGYSTIALARGAGPDGRVVTLEIDPNAAATARANFEACGVADRITLIEGAAADTLAGLSTDDDPPFDLSFIDADKVNNPVYIEHAVRLSRPGGLIIVDNVVRDGRVLDAHSDDPSVQGTREAVARLARHPRLEATAIQTVGAKDWDGLALARVL